MSDNIRTIVCDDLDEFWDLVSPIGTLFTTEQIGVSTPYVFRGQRDSNWQLVPRVFRQGGMDHVGSKIVRELFFDYPGRVILEYSLLLHFLNYCDSRGLAIPGDSMAFRDYLSRLRESKHGENTHSWPDQEIQPLMALAQHHGVPTRLLDVSSNPIVAAYFAAASAVEYTAKGGAHAQLVVCGIQMVEVPGVTRVRVPGNTSPNLSAQSGSFLLLDHAGVEGEVFVHDVSLESKVEKLRPTFIRRAGTETQVVQPMLIKVTLPTRLAPLLLHRCHKFGINASSVFPGYDGAAKAVLEMSAARLF